MELTGTVTEVKDETDLLGPGAVVGSIPTDLEQATGLERFEILGKMQGIDVFDMKPLDASRRGTTPFQPAEMAIRPLWQLRGLKLEVRMRANGNDRNT